MLSIMFLNKKLEFSILFYEDTVGIRGNDKIFKNNYIKPLCRISKSKLNTPPIYQKTMDSNYAGTPLILYLNTLSISKSQDNMTFN